MWVDIFPKSRESYPPPVNIAPRTPDDYVLRVVVYNVKDVELKDRNRITKERMSDIYVKGYVYCRSLSKDLITIVLCCIVGYKAKMIHRKQMYTIVHLQEKVASIGGLCSLLSSCLQSRKWSF